MLKNRPLSGMMPGARLHIIILLVLLVALPACQSVSPTPTPLPSPLPKVEARPVPGGPLLLRGDITLNKVVDLGGGYIKLVRHPLDGTLYFLHPVDGIHRVELTEPAAIIDVASISDFTTDGFATGMTFGPDGTLYVVVNRKPSQVLTQAEIFKGMATNSGGYTWQSLAMTEPYPASNTNFDHLFNGITVSADGRWVFVSSGSRTDHGEVQSTDDNFPGTREVPLTSKIFRLPADTVDQLLPNDIDALTDLGVIFASGTRNAYDLAFAPNGDLFGVDNGPDADYPDELNWIREGKHYGFPWRFGSQDNPQQFADYDAGEDKRLSQDFVAVQTGTYRNDPDYPPPPGPFTDPVSNLGLDATQYRDDDGRQADAAAEGIPLHTFTPHRSPLGLVFTTDSNMPADLQADDESLSAFVLSWGSAGGSLSDKGQDLLHLRLTKRGDNYEAITTQIVREFKNPIDAVMIENRLYVLEFGTDGAIWELIFN